MNGVHDMGGMHGMGPIEYQLGEPVFHTRWEARAFALTLAMGAWRKWNIDAGRHSRELIPAAEYLRMSYYEKWIAGLVELSVAHGLVTTEEIESAVPAPGSAISTPPLTADKVPMTLHKGGPTSRDVAVSAGFHSGDRVRACNMNPTGHTRLPRYLRGKLGLIDRDHGVFVFPDTNAHFLGENPQHVYSVRFSARELWGAGASARDAIYADLWESYLEST